MNELISKLKVVDEIYNISTEEGFNNWNAHKVLNRVMYNVLHMQDESTEERTGEDKKTIVKHCDKCETNDGCLCNSCARYSPGCCDWTRSCPIISCTQYVARNKE